MYAHRTEAPDLEPEQRVELTLENSSTASSHLYVTSNIFCFSIEPNPIETLHMQYTSYDYQTVLSVQRGNVYFATLPRRTAMSTRTNFPSVHSFINFDATKIIILLIFNTKSINRVRNVLINRYYFVNREHCNRMWFAYTLSADTAHA